MTDNAHQHQMVDVLFGPHMSLVWGCNVAPNLTRQERSILGSGREHACGQRDGHNWFHNVVFHLHICIGMNMSNFVQ